MVELSMADVAGGGFAVGAALAGRRPMYIIRYEGFNWFNAPIIVNYACKSKEIWGVSPSLFYKIYRYGRRYWAGCRLISPFNLL